MKNDRIIIFDTTLRDGEQCPGAAMSFSEKLTIAKALDEMGVDMIEAGFAAASEGDLECIQAIARTMKNAGVCSLSRAKKADIDASAAAIKDAQKPRIHTFIGTSPIHRQHQLKMSEAEVLAAIEESVRYARNYCPDIEWSAMDATRTEIDFLARAIETAIRAGATTINIPDTVGYALPHEYAELIRTIRNKVPNIDQAIIAVHCHNDLGLAVANSLAGIEAGARQLECTINGLGERAGNAALEEIVMAMKTRHDLLPFHTNIDASHIARVSRLVSTTTGFVIQKNKAIVGANAFSHASGIHQDGVLKAKETFEIMQPESIGLNQTELALGKHSGRAAVKDRLKNLNIEMDNAAFETFFERFKALGDRKKEVFDEDLMALIEDAHEKENTAIEFVSFHTSGASSSVQSATVVTRVQGEEKTTYAQGDGPLDAVFTAINKAVNMNPGLSEFHVHAVSSGPDAQAESTVNLTYEDKTFVGKGFDTDTMVSAAKAYIHAMNKLMTYEARLQKTVIPMKTQKKADYIWLNGEFIPWDTSQTHIITHGLHYGSAVFEGARAYNGKVFKMQEHNERLHRSAEMLDFNIPFSVEILNQATQELLKRNQLTDAYIRPIAWVGGDNLSVASKAGKPQVAIAAWKWGSYYGAEVMEKGLRVMWADWVRPAPHMAPVAAKASGLYVIGSLTKNKAEAAGYHDALMLDFEGYIAECTSANFFMIINGELHTPIADRFLNGITRQTVIELSKTLGIPCVERRIRPEELAQAQETFVTGSAAEVVPVGEIGEHRFAVGPITQKIMHAYATLVRS